LFGATDFSQQMLRFEEFGVHPIPVGTTPSKDLPLPAGCTGRPDPSAMDTFLDAPLWPAPSVEANVVLGNPWANMINPCLSLNITGVIEGRPPGTHFAHQRATEFPPQVYFQTAQGGARTSNGARDDEQRHTYSAGEFGPTVVGQEDQTGLYNNTAGVTGLNGTTSGISIKFHPLMPVQDPKSLWTFGDGTLPPKLLQARYGEPVLMRHYDALPIDVAANNGFGEHTITTHEHNGHNPGESDGFAGAYFFPGEFYDYRWPMTMAGFDSINTDASDPRASTPCSPGETMMIPDPITGSPVAKTCDPVTGTVNVAGDWHEIMSTHWFHDHMIDRTSENVYKGNAAMMNYYSGIDRGKEGFRCEYDDPAHNINLCFPSGTALDWGNRDYDVQLLVADKAWDPINGQLSMAPLNTEGFLADRMTVNWLYKPYLDVRARKYRFRILNGAVARFYKMAFVQEFNDATTGTYPGPLGSNKSYSRISFHMIANDGNIMEHTVPFPNAQSKDLPMQAIAERYDIIIDFSQFPVGTKIYMVNTVEHANGQGPKGVVLLANILNGTYAPVLQTGCANRCWKGGDPAVGKVMEFRVQPYSGTDLSMNPADYEVGKRMMIPLVKFTDAELAAATHRTFTFGKGGGISTDGRPIDWAISTDGGAKLHADVNRVSAAPETMGGGVEIWHIVNGGGGWAHPVHVHFEESQYLLRGDPNAAGTVDYHLPPVWEIGARKDMYRVSGLGGPLGLPDSSMVIDAAIRFREFAGTFVEHCHNTTHEDKAMLLRWDNENPGQTVRIPTPVPEWDGVKYVGVNGVTWTREDGTIATGVDTLLTAKSGDVAAAATFVAPKQILGDLNLDGIVNTFDLGIFKSHYRKTGLWSGDLDENLRVNTFDLSLFKANYRKSAGFPLPPNDPFGALP
jgi:FtsP/CotA-like multicopper oxidase with cupredoxin domain